MTVIHIPIIQIIFLICWIQTQESDSDMVESEIMVHILSKTRMRTNHSVKHFIIFYGIMCDTPSIDRWIHVTVMFGRPMHSRLPEVNKITPNQRAINRHPHQKATRKDNVDSRLKLVAEEFLLQIGDTVLLRGGIAPKELTPYDPNPFKVIDKNGSMITASRNEESMTRNSSHFKRIIFYLLVHNENHTETMMMNTGHTSSNQLPKDLPIADSMNLTEECEPVNLP